MKKEFTEKPINMKEAYPGQFKSFSWQDFVVALPTPLMIVTSYKANGLANACMQAWSTMVGSNQKLIIILASVSTKGHLYQTLLDKKCCVVNFFTYNLREKCQATIKNNNYDLDEITASGLTVQQAKTIEAPLIDECFLNIECKVLWSHPLSEGSNDVTFALEATNIIMDEDYYNDRIMGRYNTTGYLFNIHNPMNPETGETSPDSIGVIKKVS